jgi:hypothetical protein
MRTPDIYAMADMRCGATAQGNHSNWCGTILQDESDPQLWHMYNSDFAGCGLGIWITGSRVIHTTSRGTPLGPYVPAGAWTSCGWLIRLCVISQQPLSGRGCPAWRRREVYALSHRSLWSLLLFGCCACCTCMQVRWPLLERRTIHRQCAVRTARSS